MKDVTFTCVQKVKFIFAFKHKKMYVLQTQQKSNM